MPAKLLFLTSVVSVAVLANPQIKNESPKAPPEVKKTVNALAGRWHFEGTDSEPRAAAPQRVVMEIECRQAALGTAVACTLTGRMAGFGPLEAAAIVGYNQDEHLVHWMEISSTGEYHDHRGKWKGDRIEFEPLVYKALGKKSTDRFALTFPSSGRLVLKSVTETVEGISTLRGPRSALKHFGSCPDQGRSRWQLLEPEMRCKRCARFQKKKTTDSRLFES